MLLTYFTKRPFLKKLTAVQPPPVDHGLANLSCQGPESKYSWLANHLLLPLLHSAQVVQNQPQTTWK